MLNSQQLLMFALFSFFVSHFHCHAIIGPITPGQSLWSINQKIAIAADTIETKIDVLENDLAILITENEDLHSKIDNLAHRDFANIKSQDQASVNPIITSNIPPFMTDGTTTSHQSIKLQCVNLGNGKIVVNINNSPSSDIQYELTSPSERSKPLGFLKIVTGTTLVLGCLICGTIGGIWMIIAGFADDEPALLTMGPILAGASLPLEYLGYKLVKSGVQDLKQSKKPHRQTETIKKNIKEIYDSHSHPILHANGRRLHGNK